MTTPNNAHQPLIDALQAIVQHYANPNLSHQDYRVKACQQAEHALAHYRDAQLATLQRPAAAPAPKLDLPYISIRDVDPETLDTLRGLLKPRPLGQPQKSISFSTPTGADSADYFRHLLNQFPYQAEFVTPYCPEGHIDEISEGQEARPEQLAPPKPLCECGDPYCLKGSQTFTPRPAPAKDDLAWVAQLAELASAPALLDRLDPRSRLRRPQSKSWYYSVLAVEALRRRCKQVEMDRDELFQVTRDALHLLKDLVGQLDWARGTPALDAIDVFLNSHAATMLRIAANVSPAARQESV